MSEKLDVTVSTEDKLFGSSQYRLSVKVANAHNEDITDLNVEPILVPGKLIFEAKQTELSRLESQKRLLIEEMEWQIARAVEMREISQMPAKNIRLRAILSSVFARKQAAIPPWATEALKITDWFDVERLEREFISSDFVDPLSIQAFSINKDKLGRCLKELEQMKTEDSRSGSGMILSSGDSTVFVFTIKAPRLFRPRVFDAQFRIVCKDSEHNRVSTLTKSERLNFHASHFSIPLGAAIGAVFGYIVRLALIPGEQQANGFQWFRLFGSIVLGVIAAFLTAKSPESKKVITVEDVLGGFIIGALSGLFTDKIVEKIENLLK